MLIIFIHIVDCIAEVLVWKNCYGKVGFFVCHARFSERMLPHIVFHEGWLSRLDACVVEEFDKGESRQKESSGLSTVSLP